MNAVLSVAGLAFKESARNRVLHALLAAMLLAAFVAHVLAWVTGDDAVRRVKVVADLSLSALVLLGSLAAIFLGTHSIYQEVERRTVYTVLARPISRGSFVLGKYLGLVGIVGVASAAMGVLALGAIWLAALHGGVSPAWGKLLLALVGTGLELAVVAGVALFFSVAAHPIEGAVFAAVTTAAGHMTHSLRDLGKHLLGTDQDAAGTLAWLGSRGLEVLYVVLPNLEHTNLRPQAVHDLAIDPLRLLWALLHALLWMVILVSLSSLVFRRRVL